MLEAGKIGKYVKDCDDEQTVMARLLGQSNSKMADIFSMQWLMPTRSDPWKY